MLLRLGLQRSGQGGQHRDEDEGYDGQLFKSLCSWRRRYYSETTLAAYPQMQPCATPPQGSELVKWVLV